MPEKPLQGIWIPVPESWSGEIAQGEIELALLHRAGSYHKADKHRALARGMADSARLVTLDEATREKVARAIAGSDAAWEAMPMFWEAHHRRLAEAAARALLGEEVVMSGGEEVVMSGGMEAMHAEETLTQKLLADGRIIAVARRDEEPVRVRLAGVRMDFDGSTPVKIVVYGDVLDGKDAGHTHSIRIH